MTRLEQRDERLTQLVDLLAQRAVAPAKSGGDWDAYAAVIASFIGILALAVSGYTAYVQRQQLRAQVWPHLQLKYSDTNLSFWVSNQGTGPARITAVRVTVDGKPVKTWADVKKIVGFPEEAGMTYTTLNQAVIPADKDFVIIQPTNSDAGRTKFKELMPDHAHPISIVVCYCSVLDDCWVSALGSLDNPLYLVSRGCPVVDADQFED